VRCEGNWRGMYSKEEDLASCGMLPREAILVMAGGWPDGGGGVVLPSYECPITGAISCQRGFFLKLF
jgi:hypothetical protein